MGSRLRIVALALLLAAFLTGGAAARSHATGGSIVFAADRSPLFYGEIYRVDRSGRRVDLSRSPARDLAPAVSPDGRLVAFSSNRGARLAIYVVRIDGTHLHRVSPFFGSGDAALGPTLALSWSPGGGRLLAVVPGSAGHELLWTGAASGTGHILARGDVQNAAWAPGGRELAWLDGVDVLHVITPAGKRLWQGIGTTLSWSATGRLAVSAPGPEVLVYDAAGRKLATVDAGASAWSPDGKELATLGGKDLRQLQVRAGGAGKPLVDTRISARNGWVQWVGSGRLRIFNGHGWIGYDVRGRRPWKLPAGLAAFDYPGVVSRSGAAVAVVRYPKSGPTLAVSTLAGRIGKTLATAPPCGDDTPFFFLQFTPNAGALVYQDDCYSPSADLYSIRSDGTGLRLLTATPTDETDPAVSPDSIRIAYARQDAGACKGCPQTLWEMNADGSGRHALTTAPPQASLWFDAEPSFSPDGRTIVYAHSDGNVQQLVEIPSEGGARRTLTVSGTTPAWGATRIAFWNAQGEIETVPTDGTQTQSVIPDQRFGGALAWSHDGRLAWLDADGSRVLSLAIWNGTAVTHVSLGSLKAPGRGSGLAWSPEGTRLAFTAADAEGISDVWTVAPGGTGLTRVTHDLGAVAGLSWGGG
jgi:Tol biopolymer transport system component